MQLNNIVFCIKVFCGTYRLVSKMFQNSSEVAELLEITDEIVAKIVDVKL